MTICSRCGTEATPTDYFCKKCGQRIAVQDANFALADRAPAYVPPSTNGQGAELAGASGALTPSALASSDGAGAASDVNHSTSASSASVATMTATATESSTESSTESDAESTAEASTIERDLAVARLLVRPVSSSRLTDMREYALDGQNIAIGRSPSCDIVLEGDQLISRRHALLRYDGERYIIVDLSSSNGTFVNDSELTEAHPLAEGDRIQLGEYELTYVSGPASPAASWTGAHNGALISGHGPAPKTEPHLVALSPADIHQLSGESGPLAVPDPAERTIPKSDLVAASNVAPPSEAAPGMADHSEAASSVAAEDDAPTVTPVPATVSDLEALRHQVASMMTTAETLAKRADAADRHAEQRYAALVEARDRLSGLISELQRITSDAEDGDDLSPLLRIVRLAADNPRHVDYMMQLADSAGEILNVLETRQARQAAPTETLNALTTLRAWLSRLD